MDSYNFWQDFFDTYQSLSDWMKALWMVAPPTFILMLVKLVAHGSKQREPVEPAAAGRLIYSIYRDDQNRTHILSHIPERAEGPGVLVLNPFSVDGDRQDRSARLWADESD